MPLIMNPPTYSTKKKLTHFTRRLGFSPDYWALHPTTGLFTRLLGFSPNYWALHPTTWLCIRLLGFASNYWAFIRILYSIFDNFRLYPPVYCRILPSISACVCP